MNYYQSLLTLMNSECNVAAMEAVLPDLATQNTELNNEVDKMEINEDQIMDEINDVLDEIDDEEIKPTEKELKMKKRVAKEL